jgi:hypothetical protein
MVLDVGRRRAHEPGSGQAVVHVRPLGSTAGRRFALALRLACRM